MKSCILLVGEDPVLLETRALLLADWETRIASSREAPSALKEARFDVIILGQMVTRESVQALNSLAQRLEPVPAVLAIRNTDGEEDLGVEIHVNNFWESPGWLKAWVESALGSRGMRKSHGPVTRSSTGKLDTADRGEMHGA